MKKIVLFLLFIFEYSTIIYAQFGSEQIISSSSDGAYDVELADIDNDGDLDIISLSYFNQTLAWHENLGGGIFDTVQSVISSDLTNATFLEVADLDNDLDVDIMVTSTLANKKLVWFENLGGGQIDTIKKVIHKQYTVRHVYSIDLDLDGDNDILTTFANDDIVAWHENLGGGVIDTNYHVISAILDLPWHVNAADMDGDNDPDVISVSGNADKVVWFENLGGGVIDTVENLISNVTIDIRSTQAADIDNDGDLDVFVASQGDSIIGWCENLGGGIFGPRQTISNQHNYLDFVDTADIDLDGDIDAIVISIIDNKLVWYENLGGGIFGPQQLISINSNTGRRASIGDTDNDGDLDIVYASTGNDQVLLYQNYTVNNYTLKGKVFFDNNQNAVIDTNEQGLPFIQTHLQSLVIANFSANNGDYFFGVTDTTLSYTIGYITDTLWNLTTDSTTYNRSVSLANPIIDSLNFGFYPDTILTIIHPDLTGAFPRCNNIINYWANIHNYGTTKPNGVIHIQLDDSISYISSSIIPDSINGQNIYWHYDSLFYHSNELIDLQVQMPPFTSMGDTLKSYITVHELDGGNNIIYTNTDSLEQVSVCAYDPNDKKVLPKGVGVEGFVQPNLNMEYLIRFQNTGNDTAINIVIKDTLDTNLDWSSLKPVSSSHNVQISIDQNGQVTFTFNNIMLPDSGVDFLASQGYVKYTVEQIPNLLPNTEIYNTANIYFDNNPAIVTNTVLNTIECYGTPNPMIVYNTPYLESGVSGNYTYQWYLNGNPIAGANADTLLPSGSGNYTVEVIDSNNCSILSQPFNFIITGLNYYQIKSVSVYPNPFIGKTNILFSDNLKGDYDLVICNLIGAEVKRINNLQGRLVEIDKKDIGQGVFLVYLVNKIKGDKLIIEKIVSQ